jgi:cell fate regulator YaaT (PSP1 superfamily)
MLQISGGIWSPLITTFSVVRGQNRRYRMKCCRVNFSLFFLVVIIASSAEELVHFLRRPVEAVAVVARSRLEDRNLEVQDTSALNCKKFSIRG